MTPEFLTLLTLAVLVIAFLYSSVGHAGASGYIAKPVEERALIQEIQRWLGTESAVKK